MDKKEREGILSQPFKVWPEPKPGCPYGPTDLQKLAFIEMLNPRPHHHGLDIFLFDGANRSGKTITACARTMQYLLAYPGSVALVGAENQPLLQRTALEEWRKRFTVYKDWDHPLVDRYPTQHTKRLRLRNGSTAWFLHFNDFKILRGVEADIVHIEEASLLPNEESMNELVRRLSGRRGPVKQLILTTNPEESRGWIYEKFALKQDEPDYDGSALPRGERCKCQYCPTCMNAVRGGSFSEWIKAYGHSIMFVDGVCPTCSAAKDNECPGDQEFFRVVRTRSADNPHLPSDYVDNMRSSMSEEYFALYGEGKLVELRKGKTYKSFSKLNVSTVPKQIDYSKPLIWTFDFNVSYQCSVLCQESEGRVDVIDEFILPEAGPEHVAKEFLRRYPNYFGEILIYGDPAALNRKTSSTDISQFQVIYNILHSAGKNVTVTVKKIEKLTKVPVIPRVDCTNMMLCDATGMRRLFINPHCKFLLLSLEDLRWKETAGQRSQIDTQCDKNAAKNPNKRILHLLSHPTDALGYYLYKKFPIVVDRKMPMFVQIPEAGVVDTDGNFKRFKSGPPRPNSVMDSIRKLGVWGNDFEDNFW